MEIVIAIPKDALKPLGARDILCWRPQNQVLPTISVSVRTKSLNRFEYRYSIANSNEARLAIDSFWLVVPKADTDIRPTHNTWGKLRMKDAAGEQAAHPVAPTGDFVNWGEDLQDHQIAPGQSQGNFVLEAGFLPGFTTAYCKGGSALATPGELPFEVAEQLIPMMKLRENWRRALTIGPRFEVGISQSTMAVDYLIGFEELVKAGQLKPESTFLKYSRERLEACKRNRTDACAEAGISNSNAEPTTPIEKDILGALRIAFGATK